CYQLQEEDLFSVTAFFNLHNFIKGNKIYQPLKSFSSLVHIHNNLYKCRKQSPAQCSNFKFAKR
ncbi:MAG TPA: hypothetical protein VF623_16165, partial [Segetibacter sp.]